MTIPQQECKEKKVPKCKLVAREECKMVPEEKCTEENVEEKIEPGQCRVNTRLDCNNRPRQKCGRTVRFRRSLAIILMSFLYSKNINLAKTIILKTPQFGAKYAKGFHKSRIYLTLNVKMDFFT